MGHAAPLYQGGGCIYCASERIAALEAKLAEYKAALDDLLDMYAYTHDASGNRNDIDSAYLDHSIEAARALLAKEATQ